MGTPEEGNGTHAPARGLVEHYKKLLGAWESAARGDRGLESLEVAGGGEPDLSSQAIAERLSSTRAELRRIIKDHLGDKAELYEVAEQILAKGGEALRVLRGEDEAELAARADILDGLEAIVRSDGSRPSFMVRNGEVDITTSPAGAWADSIAVSADMLSGALECVGRIDVPGSAQGFQGTGFLVHESLILTNRHVLQETSDWQEDGTWTMKPGAAIDFGHEFRARASLNRRALRNVVFCGRDPISGSIDHKKLDLALIELEPPGEGVRPRMVLAVEAGQDWAQPQLSVYAVGYPGNPGPFVAAPTLLETLFRSTYGHKRLAPGLLMPPPQGARTWTLAHDATTLGGNSGSVILVSGREHTAAGLHYGGRWSEPRENWGHVVGSVLDEPGGCSGKTLREHFADWGVRLVDSLDS